MSTLLPIKWPLNRPRSVPLILKYLIDLLLKRLMALAPLKANRNMQLKKRAYEILEVAAPADTTSRLFDIFILSLIVLNVVAIVLETVEFVYEMSPFFFRSFEVASVLIFSVEYLLRIWSCTASSNYASPVYGRIRFALTPLALIDLLAILPFYLSFLDLDLLFIRALRLFRLFRIAKLSRYSLALQTFGRILSAKKEELLTTLFFLFLLLLFASSLMYFAENEAQPEHFSSIPATMWWAIVTLTTVGYGDTYPVTGPGKFLAAVIAILGIGMFALPTGILGAAFVEEIQNRKISSKLCPHCGKEINE